MWKSVLSNLLLLKVLDKLFVWKLVIIKNYSTCLTCYSCYSSTGNLTKHMKSKAHMKKCLELGVSVTMDDTEIQEHGKMLCTSLACA